MGEPFTITCASARELCADCAAHGDESLYECPPVSPHGSLLIALYPSCSARLSRNVALTLCPAATAFVFSHVFDEFVYNPDAARPSQPSQDDDDDEVTTTAFDIPLGTLMDCLNVFGTAGASSTSQKKKKTREDGEDSDGGGGRADRKGKGRADAGDAGGNARLDQWFAPGKGTGMRMSYAGPGHPLTLLV